MDFGIKDKVAVVTGGGSGIGLASAKALAVEGVKLVITGTNEDKLKQAADEIGADTKYFVADVSKTESVQALHEFVNDTFGPASIVVHAAGIGAGSDLKENDDQVWLDVYDTNVVGTVRVAREFIPDMAQGKWGRFVIVGSEDGSQPYPGGLPYAVSKGAVNTLSKGLSKTFADDGVLVNVVSPAFIETPMTDSFVQEMADDQGVSVDEAVKKFLKNERPGIVLKRRGQPEEVGSTIAFLCSQQAGFITGANYRVDGGSIAIV